MSFNMVCDGLRALASWIYQKDYAAQMAREVEQYSTLLVNVNAMVALKEGSAATTQKKVYLK